MNTLYLGEEQVEAYLNDLAERLLAAGPKRPTAWFPIGRSGEILVERLLLRSPDLQTNMDLAGERYHLMWKRLIHHL